MSVPTGERKENRLDVFLKAQDLCAYTLKICVNPKVFKPEYQNALTDDIITKSKDIFLYAWEANNIRVGSHEEYVERVSLQNRAIRSCVSLLALMQIAQPIFHLKLKRLEYWGKKVVNVKTLLIAWRDSDKKRYSSYK